jgi:hypothetical protein
MTSPLAGTQFVAIGGRRLPFMQFFAAALIGLALIDVVYNAFRVLV